MHTCTISVRQNAQIRRTGFICHLRRVVRGPGRGADARGHRLEGLGPPLGAGAARARVPGRLGARPRGFGEPGRGHLPARQCPAGDRAVEGVQGGDVRRGGTSAPEGTGGRIECLWTQGEGPLSWSRGGPSDSPVQTGHGWGARTTAASGSASPATTAATTGTSRRGRRATGGLRRVAGPSDPFLHPDRHRMSPRRNPISISPSHVRASGKPAIPGTFGRCRF